MRDGEGATKLIQVSVTGTSSKSEAKVIAETIATSSLVKTAIYGHDANWGRIVCAVGYSSIPIVTSNVALTISSPNGAIDLFASGAPLAFSEEKALAVLKADDIFIDVTVGSGPGEAKYWTCDFSEEYVRVNADYRS